MRYTDSPADFLGPPQRFIFNYTLLLTVVLSLTPSTPIIFIGSQNLSTIIGLPSPIISSIEPIYGTHYEVNSLNSYHTTV